MSMYIVHAKAQLNLMYLHTYTRVHEAIQNAQEHLTMECYI